MIQSHRGAGVLAPENTIEAFELGWKLGTWPEADVRTTKDGVIVAFHDNTFRRTVRSVPRELRRKGVKDITFAELSALDVGQWRGAEFDPRRVPRLSEALSLMTGRSERRLYLDIKQVDLKPLAEEVRAAKVERQIVFTSKDYALIREWKGLVPESQTMLWLGGTEAEIQQGLSAPRAAKFAGLSQVQVHVRRGSMAAGESFDVSHAFLRDVGAELRQHGVLFQVLPYDISEQNAYWQLLDLGVMAFATDHPDQVLEAVRNYYGQR